MKRLAALLAFPAIYTIAAVANDRVTRARNPDISDVAMAYGNAHIAFAVLAAQIVYLAALALLARRVRCAEPRRLALFAASGALLAITVTIAGARLAWVVESRWWGSGGFVLFLAMPLLAPLLAVLLSGRLLRPPRDASSL